MTMKRLDKYITSDLCKDEERSTLINSFLQMSLKAEELTKDIRVDEPNKPVFPLVKGNQDLVLTGSLGRIGAAILKEMNADLLEKRFPVWFLKEVGTGKEICAEQKETLTKLTGALSETMAERKGCVTAAYSVCDGGLYRPLYQLGKDTGKGYRVDYHTLPIRQTTIEICEVFDADPLRTFTGLSMLVVTTEGNRLVRELKEKGIEAAVIGYTTDDKDKLLIHDGVESRINRPEPDEVLKQLLK